MVRHLPLEQKRAYSYGIWGAFGFRLIAVALSSYLLWFWQFKVVGGLYLSVSGDPAFHIGRRRLREQQENPVSAAASGGTVISVYFCRISHSASISIVAAVALAPKHLGPEIKYGTVHLGGVLGIIAMRFVAGYFLVLLERFGALRLGGLLSRCLDRREARVRRIPLDGAFLKREMPEWLFWTGMLLIVVISLLYRPKEKTGDTDRAGRSGDD